MAKTYKQGRKDREKEIVGIIKSVFDKDRIETYDQPDRKHLQTDLRIVIRKINYSQDNRRTR